LALLGISEASNGPFFLQVVSHSVNNRDCRKCWLLAEFIRREFLVLVSLRQKYIRPMISASQMANVVCLLGCVSFQFVDGDDAHREWALNWDRTV
jgi:hypothetical protein